MQDSNALAFAPPAVAISKDLAIKGRVDLRGYAVTSTADLASLAQVFRDPRIETMRFFYVKDGKIVGHEGITSPMPGSALVLPISASDLEGLTRFVGGSNMGLHSLTQRGAIHQELRPTVPR